MRNFPLHPALSVPIAQAQSVSGNPANPANPASPSGPAPDFSFGEAWSQAQGWVAKLQEMVVGYAPKLAAGLALFIGGWFAINFLGRGLQALMNRRSLDVSVEKFIQRLVVISLRVVLIITVAGMLGFQTTSLVALLGAVGLAVGMAMSGALQNFAGGVIILLQRPFRVGHLIEIADDIGRVEEIGIFHTELKTVDSRCVLIPNGEIISSTVTNFDAYPLRRLDLVFSAGYEDDIDEVKAALGRALEAEPMVLSESADRRITIGIKALGESSVDYGVRAWVRAKDFVDASWNLNERVKREFDAAGIDIPYPHQVQVDKVPKEAALGAGRG